MSKEDNMRRRNVAILLLVASVAAAALGCNFATQMMAAPRAISTGQALATEFATQVDLNKLSTEMATQVGAVATQIAEITPEAVETQIGALATDINQSGAVATVMGVATQISTSPEGAPADIPILEGDKSAFIASPQTVSYITSADFKQVLAFYQKGMLDKGWTAVQAGTRIGDNDAELVYEKDGKKAQVVLTVIPYVNQTTVVIAIQ
jgi:hypothetical protein